MLDCPLDGETLVDALAGGKVAGPFPVKRGTRTVTVSDGSQTSVTNKVKLPAGSNSEIVVHLPSSPTGDPLITRFENNLRAVQKGRAAEAVAHVAAAGPIEGSKRPKEVRTGTWGQAAEQKRVALGQLIMGQA